MSPSLAWLGLRLAPTRTTTTTTRTTNEPHGGTRSGRPRGVDSERPTRHTKLVIRMPLTSMRAAVEGPSKSVYLAVRVHLWPVVVNICRQSRVGGDGGHDDGDHHQQDEQHHYKNNNNAKTMARLSRLISLSCRAPNEGRRSRSRSRSSGRPPENPLRAHR